MTKKSAEIDPLYPPLEEVGKKSYGLYLMNLIVLSLMLIVIRALLFDLLDNQVLVQPILFAAGLAIPLIVTDITARSPRGRCIAMFSVDRIATEVFRHSKD